MGLDYKMILWNKNKKRYDQTILSFMFLYLLIFCGLSLYFYSEITLETLLIRAFGTLAFFMLNVILMIGPLARLNKRFLPLLYNRRHLGVCMFLTSAVHGILSIVQFQSLGNVNPIYSLFVSNMDYDSLVNFPFQVLGFLGLLILFFMAATSHDFWLKNLGHKAWKRLHMLVYVAYALLILHVFLGHFQQHSSIWTVGFIASGFIIVAALHLIVGFKEFKIDHDKITSLKDGWIYVCVVDDIIENRAKMVNVNNERVAVFKYDGKLSAIHNVCKHQGGPLGEGKIVDGCITCPWHGYQYLPENGQSPPPFTEKVATYRIKLIDASVYINPKALPEGTPVEPLIIDLS